MNEITRRLVAGGWPFARQGDVTAIAQERFREALSAPPVERRSRVIARAVLRAARQVGPAAAPALLRNLPELARNRADGALVTVAAARHDPLFQARVREGDASREAAAWPAAAGSYRAALDLYPLHPGYWIQLGHVRKELGLTHGAEAAYRSARALGASADEVEQHLLFVCSLNGVELGNAPLQTGSLPLDEPPIEIEARALWETFLDGPCEDETAALLMRLSPKRRLVEHLLDHPDFAARNRGLLAMLIETGGL